MKTAFINSSATFLYVLAVSVFMNWASNIKFPQEDTFLAPLSLLMLFLFSAAFTSYFVFGKPALMYIEGKKKEALTIVSYTLTFLFIYTVIALCALLISSQFI